MSTLAVVAEVLREAAPGALRARQIAELAGARLSTLSKTPETVISRDLSLDVRDRGAASRFLRVGRGEFLLKEALPSAFFNDNDAYAAAWTRNLIAAGEIAAGVVDERSIRDLRAADVASYRQCHFFSGVGVWSRALRDAGWPDDANVWTGSCPCTPFSAAGHKQGFSDEQHLWPEWFRLIVACRPAWIFGEQVSSKDGLTWLDAVRSELEGANYSLRVLDIPAACCGAPHRRQRLYFVAYARERAVEILGAAWLRARAVDAWDVANAGEGGCAVIGSSGLYDRGQPGDDAPGCCPPDEGTLGVGDTGCSRGGRDAGEVPRAQETGEGERCAVGDLADESLAPGTADGGVHSEGSVLGGAAFSNGGGSAIGGAAFSDGGGSFSAVSDGGGSSSAVSDGEGSSSAVSDGGGSSNAVSDGGGSSSAVSDGGGFSSAVRLVRGAVDVAESAPDGCPGFRPGDRIRLADDPTWGGAVRGYWADAVEWIYCRSATEHQDGCWRPTRSGIEPLVNGSSPGVGLPRSKRLRGYGNALVRPLATAFVGAVIDTLTESVHPADEKVV